jgi:hypothetical protein
VSCGEFRDTTLHQQKLDKLPYVTELSK